MDYWRFNLRMIKDVYLILRIDDNLDVLVGLMWFIFLDLNMVYY